MKIFDKWRNPDGYTSEEIRAWQNRLDSMPDLMETFRLIREIVAGHSSLLTTLLTMQEMQGNRMARHEESTRQLIVEVSVLSSRVAALADSVTVLLLDKEEKDDEPT
jgi:hypothetical protein